MKFIRKNQSIKLLFSVIWIFFFIRLTSHIDIKNNIIQFNQNNLFNFLKDSISVIIIVGFSCLLFLKIYKNYKILFSCLLLIYPICGVIGYYISGINNNYQNSILAHHFITISSVLLFFVYLEYSDYFDYKFRIKLLKIGLILLIIFFIFSIAPNIFWKIFITTDLKVSHKTDYFVQNVNGQTRIIFILEIVSFLLFKKFFLQNKSASYLFYFIGIIFMTLIYLSQSRFNTLASYIFLFFLFYNFKQLNKTSKIFYFIIIIIIPISTFEILEIGKNRFINYEIQSHQPYESEKQYSNLSKIFKDNEKDLLNFLEVAIIKKKILNSDVFSLENKFQDLKKKLSLDYENILNIKTEHIIILQDIINEINIKNEKFKDLSQKYIRTYGAALRHSCSKFLSTLDNMLTGRVCGWELLLRNIKTNNLIFGKGFFADQVYLEPTEKTSSNTFINILNNTGIIGLFIFIYFMLNFLIKNFKIGNIYNNNIYISLSHHLVLYFIFRSIFEDTLAFVSLDFILLGISILIIKSHIKKDFTY